MQQHLGQHLLCLPSKLGLLSSMYGGCGPCGLWTQTDKRKGLHLWARSWGIIPWMGMRELQHICIHRGVHCPAENDWRHIPLNSSFCYMRRIAPGAWSMMFCMFFVSFLSLLLQESLNHRFNKQEPRVQVQHFRRGQRKNGQRGKWRKWERSLWHTGIIDYIDGSC